MVVLPTHASEEPIKLALFFTEHSKLKSRKPLFYSFYNFIKLSELSDCIKCPTVLFNTRKIIPPYKFYNTIILYTISNNFSPSQKLPILLESFCCFTYVSYVR